MTTVHVLTTDGALRRALLGRLKRVPEIDELVCDDGAPPPQPRDIVVATASDCPTDRVAELATAGVRVIILAAVPREGDRDRYRQAGACAYVAMAVDTTLLVNAIAQATV